MPEAGTTLRLAVLPVFAEERWPSMDLCAEMLLNQLRVLPDLQASLRVPHFRHRFTRLPLVGSRGSARNADRLFNRFVTYPRYLKSLRHSADYFHVCDHSYAQLLHALPAERSGIFCHDLDAFRCLIEPTRDPRPRWYLTMMKRVQAGFRKASIVFCSTEAVYSEILHHDLVPPEKLRLAPYGIANEFTPGDPAERSTAPLLLHVGSCIPRKRIDVLLEVSAAVRRTIPSVSLLQIGGEWTAEQRDQLERLKLKDAVRQIRGIPRQELAEHYRRATLVLQPSDAEGFGIPVIEALACGAPVLASDLPVLREVGGNAVSFAPVANVKAWAESVCRMLIHPESIPDRDVRLQRASLYSWAHHARIIAEGYKQLRNRPR